MVMEVGRMICSAPALHAMIQHHTSDKKRHLTAVQGISCPKLSICNTF